MTSQVWAFLGVMVSVMGSGVIGWLTYRAQQKKAASDADVTSGRLALQIAQRAEKKAEEADIKVERLENHQNRLNRWWARHERRDRVVENHLARLDADMTADLPPYEAMPSLDDTYPHPAN